MYLTFQWFLDLNINFSTFKSTTNRYDFFYDEKLQSISTKCTQSIEIEDGHIEVEANLYS